MPATRGVIMLQNKCPAFAGTRFVRTHAELWKDKIICFFLLENLG